MKLMKGYCCAQCIMGIGKLDKTLRRTETAKRTIPFND